MSPDRVTVLLPTFNERENLAGIARAIVSHGYRLLIVDDDSPDGTGVIADELASNDDQIDVLHRSKREGLGPAYAAGFEVALDTDAAVLIEMDADFSHDPSDLPRLVDAIEGGADLAIGSRYVPGGATPDWPFIRRWVSRAGNFYARLALGTPVRDMTAGFRAFRRQALDQLPFREAEASGYGFQVEMAWRAHEAGLEIVEVPVVFRDRVRGSSKMGMRIVAEAMWLVTTWGVRRLLPRLRSGNQ